MRSDVDQRTVNHPPDTLGDMAYRGGRNVDGVAVLLNKDPYAFGHWPADRQRPVSRFGSPGTEGMRQEGHRPPRPLLIGEPSHRTTDVALRRKASKGREQADGGDDVQDSASSNTRQNRRTAGSLERAEGNQCIGPVECKRRRRSTERSSTASGKSSRAEEAERDRCEGKNESISFLPAESHEDSESPLTAMSPHSVDC
jgi:hypothetical protein